MITLVVWAAACAPAVVDPPEALVGERLFLEPRFAQYFAARHGGALNTPLDAGDPVLDTLARDAGAVESPFAGSTMSCRACHLVDDVAPNVHASVRTYADFARRSPVPAREDGQVTTPRNSPSLVDASLPRESAFLLHFDGEFASPTALVAGTWTGRNLGWLPAEHADAVAHVAEVLREDDGTYPLAVAGGTIPYATLLAGTDPDLPEGLRLPEALRVDLDATDDGAALDAAARLVGAYLENLQFARGISSAEYEGSPYDEFLAKNGLPRAPDAGESPLAYARRLRTFLDTLSAPAWVDDTDQRFGVHAGAFRFGAAELRGLRIFLAEPGSGAATAGVAGNCVACHAPPAFTDFGAHNTGVSQHAYDAVWGEGAFAALDLPDTAGRAADPLAWLPPSPSHPEGRGTFAAFPDPAKPESVDLGVWNVYGHPDRPESQEGVSAWIDTAYALAPDTSENTRLAHAVGLFKTPSLRDLAQSAPYLHDGEAADVDAVLGRYVRASDQQRAGTLRNGDPRLADIRLDAAALRDLRSFLDALTEDYD